MSEIPNGGPAFPVHGGYPDDDPRNHILGGGMALRDWFAGQALMMLAPPEFLMSDDMTNSNLNGVAVRAFRIADAMLKARGK